MEEIGRRMIEYVTRAEYERIPWIPGTRELLVALRDAGVPSVLVTTSPRNLAENLIAQAPAGTFAGYVCGEDDVAKKPDPAPYVEAARRLDIPRADMPQCVAFEDSMSGLTSAAASGATTIAQLGFIRTDNSDGPQYMSIDGYDGVTPESLNAVVERRIAELAAR